MVLEGKFFELVCNETLVDASGEEEPGLVGEYLWLVGIGCSIVSSVMTAVGTNLQKKAQNIQLEAEVKAPVLFGAIVLNKTWLLALLIMVFFPLPFDFAAFALAPASLIVPLTGLTIIMSQILAPLILPEKLTKIEVIATTIILAGVACTTVSAGGSSTQYSVCELIDRYLAPDFFIFAFVLAGLVGACLFFIHSGKGQGNRILEKLKPELYAFTAGACGAILHVFFKLEGELVKSSAAGVETNTWTTVYPYAHIVGIAVMGVMMIVYINLGLQIYDSVMFTPLYFCNLIVCSSTLGLIFFEEYRGVEVWQAILFPIGIVIVCIGIGVMTLKGVDVDKVLEQQERLQEQAEQRRSMRRSRKGTTALAHPERETAKVGVKEGEEV